MRAIAAAAFTTVLPMIVGRRWISGSSVLRWSLGAVVGIVVLAFGGLVGGLVGAPVVGGAIALLIGWIVGTRVRCDAGSTGPSTEVRRILVVLVAVGSALMLMSFFRPVPSWDAWFLWSLKSKGLASAGSFQSPVFLSPAYAWSSQDYPPLLPSWQGLAYLTSGDLSISWPLQFQQAWLWTAGAVALIALTDRSRRAAFLLPLAWVTCPQVVWQSMQGYADVPMALMLTLGAVVLWRDRLDPRAHVVGGTLLAGAALMKAEGIPLVAIVLVSLLLGTKPRATLALAPGIVIVAWLPWFLFTQAHGLTNHMVTLAGVTDVVLGRVPSRLPEIIGTMGAEMLSPQRWGLLVPGCLLAVFIARRVDVRFAVALLLQFALFAAVYAVTWSFQGTPLLDFMRTNVDRVLITPLGLLALAAGSSWWRTVGASDGTPPDPIVVADRAPRARRH